MSETIKIATFNKINLFSLLLQFMQLGAVNSRICQRDIIVYVGDGEIKHGLKRWLIEARKDFSGVGGCRESRCHVSENS